MSELLEQCREHTRTGRCQFCNVCKRCESDGCHHKEHRTESEDVKIWRKKYVEPRVSSGSRVAKAAIQSLNEDALAAPILDALETARREAESRAKAEVNIFHEINKCLSGDVFAQGLAEATIPLRDPESQERLRKSFVAGMGKLVDKLVNAITEDQKWVHELRVNVKDRLGGAATTSGEVLLNKIGMDFLMAKSSLHQRALFAYLLNAIPESSSLRDFLQHTKIRLLNDPNLLSQLKPRTVRLRAPINGLKSKELTVEEQVSAKVNWALSRVRRDRGKSDLQQLSLGNDLPRYWNTVRVSRESVQVALQFIESRALGWKGGFTRTICIGDDVRIFDFPALNSADGVSKVWEEYQQVLAQDAKYEAKLPVGRGTFHTMFNALCKPVTEKHALSYYFTDMIEALENLEEMIVRMEVLYSTHRIAVLEGSTCEEMNQIGCNLGDLKEAIKQALEHCKYGIRAHSRVENCDKNVHHCVSYAVGGTCCEEHAESGCDLCANIGALGYTTKLFMNAIANALGRQHKDVDDFARDKLGGPVREILSMSKPISICWKSIELYQRHVFRGIYINHQVSRTLASLKVGQVLVVLDHKQKINPFSLYESSADYYGKKGMSLLGFHLRWLVDNGKVKSRYIDCVSTNSKQDVRQVQTIMALIVPYFKRFVGQLTEVIFLSDNGPAFTGKDHMSFCNWMNAKGWNCNLKLIRWIFFEAQCGKTTLDTHFSFVGLKIVRFARSVRGVKNPRDVFDALQHDKGIASSSAFLIEFTDYSDKAEEGDESATKDASKRDEGKIDGIRKLHDIHFIEPDTAKLFDYPGINQNSRIHDLKAAEYSFTIKALVKGEFHSTHEMTERSLHKESETLSGPQISHEENAHPLSVLIAEELVQYATQAKAAPPTLLPKLTINMVASNPKKKKVKMDQDEDDLMLRRPSGWANQENRSSLTVPEHLKDQVIKAYHEGERSGTRVSPASVSEALRERDDVKRDWTARYACSEANVRKIFGSLTLQKKAGLRKNASAVLRTNQAGEGVVTTSAAVSTTSTISTPDMTPLTNGMVQTSSSASNAESNQSLPLEIENEVIHALGLESSDFIARPEDSDLDYSDDE